MLICIITFLLKVQQQVNEESSTIKYISFLNKLLAEMIHMRLWICKHVHTGLWSQCCVRGSACKFMSWESQDFMYYTETTINTNKKIFVNSWLRNTLYIWEFLLIWWLVIVNLDGISLVQLFSPLVFSSQFLDAYSLQSLWHIYSRYWINDKKLKIISYFFGKLLSCTISFLKF